MKGTGQCNIIVPVFKPRSNQNMFASPKRLNSPLVGGSSGYKSPQEVQQHIHQGNKYNCICMSGGNIQ